MDTAVIGVSMICRAAISGGLDPLVAYDRNDLYLIRVSEAKDEAEYWGIMMEALHDLCIRWKHWHATASARWI